MHLALFNAPTPQENKRCFYIYKFEEKESLVIPLAKGINECFGIAHTAQKISADGRYVLGIVTLPITMNHKTTIDPEIARNGEVFVVDTVTNRLTPISKTVEKMGTKTGNPQIVYISSTHALLKDASLFTVIDLVNAEIDYQIETHFTGSTFYLDELTMSPDGQSLVFWAANWSAPPS